MTCTGMERSANQRRVARGWDVATRRPARSSTRLRERVAGHRGRQPAAAVAETADDGEVLLGFGKQVGTGDPEISDRVAHELDDVVRADEEDVEIDVLHPAHEAAIALLELEAGVVQQAKGGFDQPALVGNRQGHPPRAHARASAAWAGASGYVVPRVREPSRGRRGSHPPRG